MIENGADIRAPLSGWCSRDIKTDHSHTRQTKEDGARPIITGSTLSAPPHLAPPRRPTHERWPVEAP
eukprot:8115596-Alexandrium_andersonii.AAC.1